MTITYDIEVVVMYDEVLYSEGHLVRRWFEGIENELTAAIKAEAPHSNEPGGTKSYPPRPNKSSGSPGDLRRGIEGHEPQRTGPRALSCEIHSTADHTWYVIGGTNTIQAQARASSGTFGAGLMILPGQPWIRRMRRGRVSGQEPNDFIRRGYEVVSAHHEALG